jgi:GntR family transcriptional regulator
MSLTSNEVTRYTSELAPSQPSAMESADPVPKYLRVRDWLIDLVLSGELSNGDKLPSESDLVRRFGVSRVTVRHALEALRTEGFIESRHGKGWFARRVRAVQNLGRLQGFGEMLAPMGINTRSHVLDVAEVSGSKQVTAAFGIPDGSRVMQIERLRIAGARVMSYDLSYFPLEIGQRLRDQDLARQDIFVLLERALGYPLGFADVTIEIVPAEDVPARRLGVPAATPIFRLTRLTHDRRGFPIDFEYVYGLPETQMFKVRVPRR